MSNVPSYRCGNDTTTNKNRRKKLKDRMKRIIDNSSIPESEKVFINAQLRTILQEYAELYEVRNENT